MCLEPTRATVNSLHMSRTNIPGSPCHCFHAINYSLAGVFKRLKIIQGYSRLSPDVSSLENINTLLLLSSFAFVLTRGSSHGVHYSWVRKWWPVRTTRAAFLFFFFLTFVGLFSSLYIFCQIHDGRWMIVSFTIIMFNFKE